MLASPTAAEDGRPVSFSPTRCCVVPTRLTAAAARAEGV